MKDTSSPRLYIKERSLSGKRVQSCNDNPIVASDDRVALVLWLNNSLAAASNIAVGVIASECLLRLRHDDVNPKRNKPPFRVVTHVALQ